MRRIGAFVFVLAVAGGSACGKKGPPLPPLVNLPAAPGDLVVARRAGDVDVQFVIPAVNMDGSKPAELKHVDVYALDGPGDLPVDEIIKRGSRVVRIDVNPPPDPDEAEDSRKKAAPAPVEDGAHQGDAAHLTIPFEVSTPPAAADDVRSFVAVGLNNRGRRGAISRRVPVSLASPPPAPAAPVVKDDETGVTVSWVAPADPLSRSLTYNVYSVGERESRQTDQPKPELSFLDSQVAWGTERCYAVRTVGATGDLLVESEPSAATCVTLKDTFPPKAPVGLQAIASEGAVNLIWDASPETDLAGYVVLRAIAPAVTPTAITPMPIEQPTFSDTVPSGSRVTYAVQAVDKAGNASPPSASVAETAR